MEWSTALESMEQVMIVFEELGGDGVPALSELVTPYRRFIRADDVQVREAPFSQNKKHEHRMYIFRDLVILAKPLDDKASKQAQTRTLSKSVAHHETPVNHGTAVVTGLRGRFKPAHIMSMGRCHVKEIVHPDGSPTAELEITYVSRESYTGKHGTMKVLTKIEKMEITCPSHKDFEEIFETLHHAIEEIEELETARRESDASTTGAAAAAASAAAAATAGGAEKKRDWARKRSTLKATLSATRMADNRSDNGDSAAGDHGLSLSDLESRYNVNLKAPSSSEKAEFEVVFGEGPMGFSLGSGPGVGVIVGRLAHGSFAEMGGVSIGDRIVSVNDLTIGLDMTWQKCVDHIKASPRPLHIVFERVASRQDIKESSSSNGGAKNATASASGGSHADSTASEEKKRAWAARRAHAQSGNNVISLNELEKMYHMVSSSADSNSDHINALFTELKEKAPEEIVKCANVMKEIFTTEKSYVSDLRTLVGEYIIPLRRTMRRSKCKDLPNAGTICEHNLIRSTCSRVSSEIHPILDANEVKTVFLNIETLVKVNSELLQVLEKGLADYHKKLQKEKKPPKVEGVAAIYGPAFVKVMPFFKMYSAYCHKYQQASERLLELRTENKELDEFLTTKEQKSMKTSLKSLLIKPIQRICKYPLLFAELVRCFPKSAEGAESLKELEAAAHAVDDIAMSVNKNVGDREAVERIMEAYEELGGEAAVPGLITAHRRFVHHVNCLLTVVGEKESKKEHTLYIFNDHLVFAKGLHGGFSVSRKSSGGLSKLASLSRKSFGFGTSSHHSHSSGHNTGKTGEKTVLKVAHRMDLIDCEIKKLDAPDSEGFHGFSVKLTERTTTTDKKDGSAKIHTSIQKFEVWAASQEDRDDIYDELHSLIERQDSLQAGQKKAEEEIGGGTLKAKRSWKDKAQAGSLSALTSKYTSHE